MISIYKKHDKQERENDFYLFLEQCKRAMNKAFGFNVNTKYETWSIIDSSNNGLTFWETLKSNGSLIYSDEFMVIDIIYDCHIYIEIR